MKYQAGEQDVSTRVQNITCDVNTVVSWCRINKIKPVKIHMALLVVHSVDEAAREYRGY